MKRCFFLILLTASSLMGEVKVVAIAGSDRDCSYNAWLAKEAAEIAKKQGATVTVIDMKNFPMPFYNEDLEKKWGMPERVKEFRRLLVESQGIIIASPEYNGSLTALLKNAIDWSSRGEGGGYSPEAFKGKKFAIMSASPGQNGGQRGLKHLAEIVTNLGGQVVSTQVSVPQAQNGLSPELRQKLEQEIAELLKKITS